MNTFIWADDGDYDIYIVNANTIEEALVKLNDRLTKIYDEKREECQKLRDGALDLETYIRRQIEWQNSDVYKAFAIKGKPLLMWDDDTIRKSYVEYIELFDSNIIDLDKNLCDELTRLYSTFPIILNEDGAIVIHHYNE